VVRRPRSLAAEMGGTARKAAVPDGGVGGDRFDGAAEQGADDEPQAIEKVLAGRAGHPCQLRMIDGPIPSSGYTLRESS
jgi:hypothetical protein